MNPFFLNPISLSFHLLYSVRSNRRVVLSSARMVGSLGIKGLVSWGKVGTHAFSASGPGFFA